VKDRCENSDKGHFPAIAGFAMSGRAPHPLGQILNSAINIKITVPRRPGVTIPGLQTTPEPYPGGVHPIDATYQLTPNGPTYKLENFILIMDSAGIFREGGLTWQSGGLPIWGPNPWGGSTGGSPTGGTTPGGSNPGGTTPSGSNPGGTTPPTGGSHGNELPGNTPNGPANGTDSATGVVSNGGGNADQSTASSSDTVGREWWVLEEYNCNFTTSNAGHPDRFDGDGARIINKYVSAKTGKQRVPVIWPYKWLPLRDPNDQMGIENPEREYQFPIKGFVQTTTGTQTFVYADEVYP
jgi:hypothetical protein